MSSDTSNEQASTASATQPSPAAMIDALNNTFGKHAGSRASHAKGFCTSGRFIADAGAAAFADSAFFKAAEAEAVVRFSVGGGNPGVSDKSRSVRGMGARLRAGDESWDLVLVSEPVFFAATPESFVSFLAARVADPVSKKPDPAKVAAHNEKFPEGKLQPALLASHPAPVSYAHTPYFSNNAFLFNGTGGKVALARVIVEPLLGTAYLSEDEEANLPDNFLEAKLAAHLAQGPVEFAIYAQLPAAGDSPIDPSQQWQGASKIKLGVLRIEQVTDTASCDGLVFSPVNLPAAIAPGADPILASRHAAYGVSLARRRQSAA